jgi:hypothetical protein
VRFLSQQPLPEVPKPPQVRSNLQKFPPVPQYCYRNDGARKRRWQWKDVIGMELWYVEVIRTPNHGMRMERFHESICWSNDLGHAPLLVLGGWEDSMDNFAERMEAVSLEWPLSEKMGL